jgi:predicted MFS family arabinose efflux permease
MTRQVTIHTSRMEMRLAYAAIFPLALGTFAIGTEGFMIAPLLPTVAADLGVSVSTAGHLVTAFAFTFALSSPILTVLTESVDRRRLLISSMIAFALANVMACVSEGYWGVMSARLLLALAAGLYVPNANALAGALVSPDKRGRALAIVNGGITMAIAFGLPLAALIGHRFGWRMTFVAVAIFSFAATMGLLLGLSRDVGYKLPIASLQQLPGVRRCCWHCLSRRSGRWELTSC